MADRRLAACRCARRPCVLWLEISDRKPPRALLLLSHQSVPVPTAVLATAMTQVPTSFSDWLSATASVPPAPAHPACCPHCSQSHRCEPDPAACTLRHCRGPLGPPHAFRDLPTGLAGLHRALSHRLSPHHMPHPGNAELISFLKVLRVISPPGLRPAPPGPRWAVWPLLRALLLSRAATRPSAVSVATADPTPGRRCAAFPELDRRRPQRLARRAPAADRRPVSGVHGTGPGRLPVSPPSACGPGSVVRSLTHYSSSSQVRSRFLRQRATGVSAAPAQSL